MTFWYGIGNQVDKIAGSLPKRPVIHGLSATGSNKIATAFEEILVKLVMENQDENSHLRYHDKSADFYHVAVIECSYSTNWLADAALYLANDLPINGKSRQPRCLLDSVKPKVATFMEELFSWTQTDHESRKSDFEYIVAMTWWNWHWSGVSHVINIIPARLGLSCSSCWTNWAQRTAGTAITLPAWWWPLRCQDGEAKIPMIDRRANRERSRISFLDIEMIGLVKRKLSAIIGWKRRKNPRRKSRTGAEKANAKHFSIKLS